MYVVSKCTKRRHRVDSSSKNVIFVKKFCEKFKKRFPLELASGNDHCTS